MGTTPVLLTVVPLGPPIMASAYDSFSETQSAEVGVRLWPVVDVRVSGAEVVCEGGEVGGFSVEGCRGK